MPNNFRDLFDSACEAEETFTLDELEKYAMDKMTVAELKRLVTVGTKLDLKHYSGWSPGVREVSRVNSVGFALCTSDGRESYCDWPKASDLVRKPGGFAIMSTWFNRASQKEERVTLLTYTFVEKVTA